MNKVFVREYSGRADLNEITRKLTLQHAVLMAAKVHVVVGPLCSEVCSTRIVLVVADAAIARNAAVHFVVDKRPKILIYMSIFKAIVAAFLVARHDCHVL